MPWMPEPYHHRDHLEGIEAFLRREGYQLDRGSLRKPSGHQATLSKVFLDWVETYRGESPLPTMAQFAGMVEDIVEEETQGSQVSAQDVPNVDEWVQEQLAYLQSPEASENGPLLKYDDTSGTWTNGVGFPATNALVEAYVLERFYELRDTMPAVRTLWPKDRIQIVLAKTLDHYTSRTIYNLRENLAFDPAKEEDGRACLRWVLGDILNVDNLEIAVDVMRHWMWQVKRYLHGLHVPAPIMVNILGPQGCGKSQLVTMLVGAPGLFGSFMETASLSTMGDSRDTDLFSSKLVVFFDELAFSSEYGDDARNLDAMKKILTSNYNSRRDMRQNSRSKMKRIFSAIAASNSSIVHKIYDPTGMRRYFEIVVKRKDKMTTEEHGRVFGEPTQALGSHPPDAMDPSLIWGSINENLEMGYIVGDIRKKVEEIQSSYKRTDVLEYILREDIGDVPHPYDGDDVQSIASMLQGMETVSEARTVLEKAYGQIELLRISAWRKEMQLWMRDHDQALSKFFPNYDNTVSALTKMKVPVLQYGSRKYLLVFKNFIDPDEGSNRPY